MNEFYHLNSLYVALRIAVIFQWIRFNWFWWWSEVFYDWNIVCKICDNWYEYSVCQCICLKEIWKWILFETKSFDIIRRNITLYGWTVDGCGNVPRTHTADWFGKISRNIDRLLFVVERNTLLMFTILEKKISNKWIKFVKEKGFQLFNYLVSMDFHFQIIKLRLIESYVSSTVFIQMSDAFVIKKKFRWVEFILTTFGEIDWQRIFKIIMRMRSKIERLHKVRIKN